MPSKGRLAQVLGCWVGAFSFKNVYKTTLIECLFPPVHLGKREGRILAWPHWRTAVDPRPKKIKIRPCKISKRMCWSNCSNTPIPDQKCSSCPPGWVLDSTTLRNKINFNKTNSPAHICTVIVWPYFMLYFPSLPMKSSTSSIRENWLAAGLPLFRAQSPANGGKSSLDWCFWGKKVSKNSLWPFSFLFKLTQLFFLLLLAVYKIAKIIKNYHFSNELLVTGNVCPTHSFLTRLWSHAWQAAQPPPHSTWPARWPRKRLPFSRTSRRLLHLSACRRGTRWPPSSVMSRAGLQWWRRGRRRKWEELPLQPELEWVLSSVSLPAAAEQRQHFSFFPTLNCGSSLSPAGNVVLTYFCTVTCCDGTTTSNNNSSCRHKRCKVSVPLIFADCYVDQTSPIASSRFAARRNINFSRCTLWL